MASLCRSAAAAAARSAALRPKTRIPRPVPATGSPAPLLRRSVVSAALGSVESLMPLHSAVAAARLRSFIAADSSYWSCLSRGLNKGI